MPHGWPQEEGRRGLKVPTEKSSLWSYFKISDGSSRHPWPTREYSKLTVDRFVKIPKYILQILCIQMKIKSQAIRVLYISVGFWLLTVGSSSPYLLTWPWFVHFLCTSPLDGILPETPTSIQLKIKKIKKLVSNPPQSYFLEQKSGILKKRKYSNFLSCHNNIGPSEIPC